MDLNCTYQFANQNNEAKLTVGQLFQAHCQLPPNVTVDLAKLKIKSTAIVAHDQQVGAQPATPPEKNYDIVFVKAAQGGEQLGVMFTSYTVGPHEISSLVLSDGGQDLAIVTPMKFEVQSVLKPDEKPEMYGPISGLGVVIPSFYWIVLAVFIGVVLSSAGVSIRKRLRRRKLLKRLEDLENGTQPLPQFFTAYRKLQRENAVFSARTKLDENADDDTIQSPEDLLKLVKSVETSLRAFLGRAFRITQFEQSWGKILKELAKYHDVLYSVLGAELEEISREFRKAGIGKNKMAPKDALLISEKTRKWVERADQLHAAIIAKDTQMIKRLRGAK
ncbi:MAG: hypothetical protein JNM24_00735 [Bdellovibrionaceae bacterium]|nr:hypothetical protein [Pseudobdellovibrionaceae bacterium]